MAQSNTLRQWSIPWRKRICPDDLGTKEVGELRRIAQQPRNYKTSKRALFILMYLNGDSRKSILAETRVSEESLYHWFDAWMTGGVDALLHLKESTPIDDPKVRAAIRKVRQLTPSAAGGLCSSRSS